MLQGMKALGVGEEIGMCGGTEQSQARGVWQALWGVLGVGQVGLFRPQSLW